MTSTKSSIPVGPFTVLGALIIVGAVALLLFGPASNYYPPIVFPPTTNPPVGSGDVDVTLLIGKPLPHFLNEKELIAQFTAAQNNGGIFGRTLGGISVSSTMTSADGAAAKTENSISPSSPPVYSTTNNQVLGVDEADIVKTDGKYIYAFYKNNIKIVEAYPAETANVITTIPLDDIYPQDMFVNGDKLIIFGTKSIQGNYFPFPYMKIAESMIARPYWGYSLSIVREYDLSDITNPTQIKELAFRGNNVSSRMIGDVVYFAITTYPDYRVLNGELKDEPIIPPFFEDGEEKVLADATDIGYIPPIYAQSFITIASLDVEDQSFQKQTIVGSAETVFASENNLYLASTQYYEPLDGIQIIALPMPSQVKTVINKFTLKDGQIVFAGQGKVPGHVLNQYSMDEFEGNFRIATTTDAVWDQVWNPGGKPSKEQANSVYVLDAEMKISGFIEDLAPGEKIYSARFMGKRAYLVTFKQVDPLFVLDLSDPANPKVLGKLKIPGYSNYLHPFDETHIIGVGKDAEVGKNDVAYYLGMKLAIFDVSDVENPTQIQSLVIGARGTDSYALQDPKAFLFDKEKGLLVLPIYLYELNSSQKDQLKQPEWQNWPEYGVPTFQGAFAYHVDLENGFKELGRITHIDKEIDLKSGYYYDYSYQVKRSLFIGSVLYTLSDKRLKANDLDNGLNEIKTIDFVTISKKFTITSWVGGGLCASPCSYQQVEITKDKIKTENFSGGENGYKNASEYPAYQQYDDLVESLDWEKFKSLDDTLGCPGCTDGLTEKVTVSDGITTKTVKMESGMKVEGIQNFLNLLRNYTGNYYPVMYGNDVIVGSGDSLGPSTDTVTK